MTYDKKSNLAENVRIKLSNLQDALEIQNKWNNFVKEQKANPHILMDPSNSIMLNSNQFHILDQYENNKYFTDEEKTLIINYLVDCLLDGEPFDCSSLGPNKYLNENK